MRRLIRELSATVSDYTLGPFIVAAQAMLCERRDQRMLLAESRRTSRGVARS